MSASTMAAQGEKTRAKVLSKLGKRPKSPADIAASVKKSTDYVRGVLVAAAKKGEAVVERDGRSLKYRRAEAPILRDQKAGSKVHVIDSAVL